MNQIVILQKIEELTFYVIEQNKKLESLEAQKQSQEQFSQKLERLEQDLIEVKDNKVQN